MGLGRGPNTTQNTRLQSLIMPWIFGRHLTVLSNNLLTYSHLTQLDWNFAGIWMSNDIESGPFSCTSIGSRDSSSCHCKTDFLMSYLLKFTCKNNDLYHAQLLFGLWQHLNTYPLGEISRLGGNLCSAFVLCSVRNVYKSWAVRILLQSWYSQ